jgi:hypothetical protein
MEFSVLIGSPLVVAQQARARMQAMLATLREGSSDKSAPVALASRMPAVADVVITACEVTSAHGTGTLLLRIFHDDAEIVSVRTSNFYEGRQSFGAAQLCLPLAQSSRPEIESWLKWHFRNTRVRRIVALPYLPADPVVAATLRKLTGAPLCTYIMDDKNVCADGIDAAVMADLLGHSGLRLVISPEMRDAYQKKYGLGFWVMPPLVPEALLKRDPVPFPAGADPRRGVLLGNIWGQRWLDTLRRVFKGNAYHIDWFCNQKDPAGLVFDRNEMIKDGITFHEPVDERALPELLSRYAFAVVPTDTLDGHSPTAVQAIAELSLPSRIPTMIATSHLPILVIGSPQTCAARFVMRFQLGEIAPYEAAAVTASLDRLLQSKVQADIRRRAAVLAGQLSAEDSAAWIWRSLAMGEPCDMRYETLMPADAPVG